MIYTNMNQIEKTFFPKDWERKRIVKLSLTELAKEDADKMLQKVKKIFEEVKDELHRD